MISKSDVQFLIEWRTGIVGGFSDPQIAMIAIAENRSINPAQKVWKVSDGIQWYATPLTEAELRAIAFPQKCDNAAASFAPADWMSEEAA